MWSNRCTITLCHHIDIYRFAVLRLMTILVRTFAFFFDNLCTVFVRFCGPTSLGSCGPAVFGRKLVQFCSFWNPSGYPLYRGVYHSNIQRTRFLIFQRDFWLRCTRFMISYRDFQRFLRSDLPLTLYTKTTTCTILFPLTFSCPFWQRPTTIYFAQGNEVLFS